jgi:catechol 2,3-dioxygenase-like lactoylglutathione lyase family enzyme
MSPGQVGAAAPLLFGDEVPEEYPAVRPHDHYRDVLGAQVIARGPAFVYRFGTQYLGVHGPGFFVKDISTDFVARYPVEPGNSDLCFVWVGSIEDAIAHLGRHAVQVHSGPFDSVGPLGQAGRNIYFRDPDGSLLEFVAYA